METIEHFMPRLRLERDLAMLSGLKGDKEDFIDIIDDGCLCEPEGRMFEICSQYYASKGTIFHYRDGYLFWVSSTKRGGKVQSCVCRADPDEHETLTFPAPGPVQILGTTGGSPREGEWVFALLSGDKRYFVLQERTNPKPGMTKYTLAELDSLPASVGEPPRLPIAATMSAGRAQAGMAKNGTILCELDGLRLRLPSSWLFGYMEADCRHLMYDYDRDAYLIGSFYNYLFKLDGKKYRPLVVVQRRWLADGKRDVAAQLQKFAEARWVQKALQHADAISVSQVRIQTPGTINKYDKRFSRDTTFMHKGMFIRYDRTKRDTNKIFSLVMPDGAKHQITSIFEHDKTDYGTMLAEVYPTDRGLFDIMLLRQPFLGVATLEFYRVKKAGDGVVCEAIPTFGSMVTNFDCFPRIFWALRGQILRTQRFSYDLRAKEPIRGGQGRVFQHDSAVVEVDQNKIWLFDNSNARPYPDSGYAGAQTLAAHERDVDRVQMTAKSRRWVELDDLVVSTGGWLGRNFAPVATLTSRIQYLVEWVPAIHKIRTLQEVEIRVTRDGGRTTYEDGRFYVARCLGNVLLFDTEDEARRMVAEVRKYVYSLRPGDFLDVDVLNKEAPCHWCQVKFESKDADPDVLASLKIYAGWSGRFVVAAV